MKDAPTMISRINNTTIKAKLDPYAPSAMFPLSFRLLLTIYVNCKKVEGHSEHKRGYLKLL